MMNDGKQQSTFLFHDYTHPAWEQPWVRVSWFMILIWYTIWYASQFSHYLAVIKLTITRFVDDVRDHQKYRIRTSSIFMRRYLFMPTCLQTSNKPLQGDSDASTTINAETWCSGGRTGLMKRWSDQPQPQSNSTKPWKPLQRLMFLSFVSTTTANHRSIETWMIDFMPFRTHWLNKC